MFGLDITSVTYFAMTYTWPWWGYLLMGATSFTGAFVFACILNAVLFQGNRNLLGDSLRKKVVNMQIKRFAKKSSWETVLKGFFPDGTDQNGTLLAQVILPEPPVDVASILVKANSLPLKVAAVADAIAFAESPEKILRRERDRLVKERQSKGYRGYDSYEEWLEKCPIIYYDHESAVAVIAQFGDFPIEQRVVDEIVNSEHLI